MNTIGILGGDHRYKLMKQMLEKKGLKVISYCCRFISPQEGSLDELLEKADITVGPIPCSRNGRSIALNDCSEIDIETFFIKLKNNGIEKFFCGAANDLLYEHAKENGVKLYDFFAMDEVAIKNAIPTAEGAVQTAMLESDKTIFGSRSLVLGFGRCGKVLARTLKALGSDVSVACRKPYDHADIFSNKMRPIYFDELKDDLDGLDFIFNTVPSQVLNADILGQTDKKTVLIDLAQAPGGVDYNTAAEFGIKAIYCPGLPGRVAPYTAAEILTEALLKNI